MMKNRWLWTGIFVCACIAAAVAVRPSVNKATAVDIEKTPGLTVPVLNETASPAATLHKSSTGTSTKTFERRALTPLDEALMSPAIRTASEAEKLASMEARASDSRRPHTPSLDQGSDNCTGVPDLGSALGVAVATGTTVGATNDLDTTGFVNFACWQGDFFTQSTLGPDVYYKWTAPATGDYTFSLCEGSASGNQYDTGITLWNFTCPTEPAPTDLICGNDDGGVCVNNFGSELTCIPLTSGQQILIVIDGYGTDSGPYSLDITACSACELVCPANGTPEGEPLCGPNYDDVYNGGCNSSPTAFQTVFCGDTICATSGTFLFDTSGFRDTDWFQILLPDTMRLTWYMVSEFPLVSYLLLPGPAGFLCDSFSVGGGPFNVAACETLSVSGCLEPGVYWLFFAPQPGFDVECGADYQTWYTCEPCVIDTTCEVAGTVTVDCELGTSFSGSTVGATNDCWIVGAPNQSDSLSPDQIWEIIIPTDGLYSFSMCTTSPVWDSYIFLTTECCGGTIVEQDDDGCGAVGETSAIPCTQLTAGTYYLVVEGWEETAVGDYTVEVICCPPCIVTCVDNEAEVECTDFFDGTNDGCNMDVPSFEPVSCGQTKCGTSGTYVINDTTNGRDLDWYVITVNDTTRITVTATAEFGNNIWILSSNCAAPITLGFSNADPCSVNTTNACVEAGTYYIVIGPDAFEGYACGSRYQFSVACEACEILEAAPRECLDEYNLDGIAMDQVGIYGTVGVISDINTNGLGTYRKWERFTVTDSICKVEWWSIHLGFSGGFIPCDNEDPMGFRVRIYPDSAGRPSSVATCDYTTSLFRTATGFQWNITGVGLTNVYYYSFDLPTCCFLANGWISIESNSIATPNCLHYWNVGDGTDNNQHWAQTNTNPLASGAQDLAFCLATNPPPCNPVTDLTIYLAPGNGGAKLFFNAPQDAVYKIYSTTNPNADGDPDGGSDADYTVEATVFFAAGAHEWTAPVGFANYKTFVVTANCN
ncbi:MAG: hypothetical protein H6508_09170 [Calditrichaeota bacterium]|nr:hypothetical protein [Calditrichota bacterium]